MMRLYELAPTEIHMVNPMKIEEIGRKDRKSELFLNDAVVQFYLDQIPTLHWVFINNEVWETIEIEGINTEQNIPTKKKDWVMAMLQLTPEHKSLLLGAFDSDGSIIEQFNRFDIALKEKYHNDIVDLIDYDKGTVILVKLIKK